MEKLEYMHGNPAKRKLVLHPKDWPWSSWSGYAKDREGLIAVNPRWGEKFREEKPKPHAQTPSMGHPNSS